MYEKMLAEKNVDKQLLEVQRVLQKYTVHHLPDEEKKRVKENQRMGELRDRYDELKFCKLNSTAMESYDKYMNVRGMLKKRIFKLPDNPVK